MCVIVCAAWRWAGAGARSPRPCRHGGGRAAILVPAAGAAQLARGRDRWLPFTGRNRSHPRSNQSGSGGAPGGVAVEGCAGHGRPVRGEAAAGRFADPAGGRHVLERDVRWGRRGKGRRTARGGDAVHARVGQARRVARRAARARIRFHAAAPPQRRGRRTVAPQIRALPPQPLRPASRGDRQLYLR